MDRYLEVRSIHNRHRVLLKIGSIREVVEQGPHTGYPGKVLINGAAVDSSYDQVKAVIESDDRRLVVDYEWPAALLWLARNRVCDVVKQLGVEGSANFYGELVQSWPHGYEECQEIWARHCAAKEVKSDSPAAG